MICPLCNSKEHRSGWIGSTVFNEKEFVYLECVECQSLYCSLMPDAEDLSLMYGEKYQNFYSEDGSHSGEDGVVKILDHLSGQPKGVFLDYGCGAGYLLSEVSKLGWECVGFEFDEAIAEKYRRKHNLNIISDVKDLPPDFRADVVHLGDVIEHLTDLSNQFPAVLKLLKEQGSLIAQGPLDANFNLFLLGIRLGKIVNRSPSTMPPYHVSLATAKGQQTFFERFGLEQQTFFVFEDPHPAPGKLKLAEIKNLRLSGLFLLRKVSQFISKFFPRTGNRYFYVGCKK